MLLINCPWCGPRDEIEFHAGGEAGRVRPSHSELLNDAQWADFLFMRRNEKGARRERWFHSQGCRRWFVIARDTVSHEIWGEALESTPVDGTDPEGGPQNGAGA